MSVRLGARYRIVGALAAGGMGAVQLALRLEPDGRTVPVAIKQLHAHLADDADVVAMFLDEARIASRLTHPNVVRVHDVEMIGEDVVIVMEFVEGLPLSGLIRRAREEKERLPLAVVRRLVHDALVGLHAAHELADANGVPYGVVHRDVSPHNILVGVDGVARLTDFGVAKATGRLASTRPDGAVKGKLQYLAPEQVFRKPVDRRTDLFAVGAVLWECLTGSKLFSGESEGETLASVLSAPIPPASMERFDVPLELDETCLRALERDPARRFATAADFARALASEGEMASRGEVSALVARLGAASIASLRAQLEEAENRPPASSSALEAFVASANARGPSAPASASSHVDGAASPPLARARTSRTLLVPVVVAGALALGTLLGVTLSRPMSPRANAAERAAVAASALPPAEPAPPPVPVATAPLPTPVPEASAKPARVPPPVRAAGRPRSGQRPDAGTKPFVPADL